MWELPEVKEQYLIIVKSLTEHEKGNLRVITSYLLERLHTVENGLGGGSLDLGRLSGKGFAKMQVLSDVEVLVKG